MKKGFTLLLLIGSLSVFGHRYHPMVREGLAWEICSYDNSQIICSQTGNADYFFHGDTIIAGNQYKNIRAFKMWPPNTGQNCVTYSIDDSISYSTSLWLRDDTLARKVLIYDFQHQRDSVLYDFTLRVGDTVTQLIVYPSSFAFRQPVIRIDTLPTGITGDSILRFNLAGAGLGGPEYYTEGKGGRAGIQFPMIHSEFGGNEVCCEIENSILLKRYCSRIVAISDPANNIAVQLAPNPFDNTLKVRIDSQEPSVLVLYDVIGNKCIHQCFTSSATVNTSQLPAGVYSYQLTNNQGVVKTGKVVKY